MLPAPPDPHGNEERGLGAGCALGDTRRGWEGGKAAVGTAGVGAAQQGLVLGRFVLLCAQQLLLSWVTMAG